MSDLITPIVMQMFLDGLSVDEILIAMPSLQRSDIETARRQAEQAKRIKDRMDREVGGKLAWRIK